MAATDVVALPRTSSSEFDPTASSRWWFVGLLVVVVGAIPILLWFGRHQWFFLDEWAFLVNRELTDVSSMLEAHNGHWVTVPAISFRVNYKLFGIDSYLPYQLPVVLLHSGVVILTWLVMQRLHVRPWIATLTALPFVFFGAGGSNILFAFQISLTGSVFCGLVYLLLSDHEAPTDRRDYIGMVFGFVGVMCSAVGVPFVVGVAVAVLLRRGLRATALHALPLAGLYLAWYVAFARDNPNDYSFGAQTFRFVERMARETFVGFGQNGLVGLALAAVAAIGITRCALRARRDSQTAELSVVAALLVTFVAFAVVTALGRAQFGVDTAASNRYVYVAAACFLPLIALGGEALAGRWIVFGAVPILLLALGLPGNVEMLEDTDPYTLGSRERVAAVAYSPLLADLPASTRLFALPTVPEMAPTAGWLRAAVADGKLSEPHDRSPQVAADADAAIALVQRDTPRERDCPPSRATTPTRVQRGDRIVFSGVVNVVALRDGVRSQPRQFTSDAGDTVAIRAGPVDVEISGPLGRLPRLCAIG